MQTPTTPDFTIESFEVGTEKESKESAAAGGRSSETAGRTARSSGHSITGIAFGILAVRFGPGAAVVAHVIFNAMVLLTARGPARSPTTERAGHGRPAGE